LHGTNFASSSKHAEIASESFGIVVCHLVGTVPEISGRILNSKFSGHFSLVPAPPPTANNVGLDRICGRGVDFLHIGACCARPTDMGTIFSSTENPVQPGVVCTWCGWGLFSLSQEKKSMTGQLFGARAASSLLKTHQKWSGGCLPTFLKEVHLAAPSQ
jgi:hypothetical protein